MAFILHEGPVEQRAARYREALAQNPDTSPTLYFTEQELRYLNSLGASQLGGWADKVRESYPALLPYLSDPEIANVLKQATDEGWPADRTQAALENTNYWRTHTEQQRQWHILQYTDPAAAQKSLFDQYIEIQRTAQLLGVDPGAGFLMNMATDVLAKGYDNEVVMDLLANWAYDHDVQGTGTINATRDQLISKAKDYVIPMSRDGLRTWTRDIVSGRANADSYEAYLRDMAMATYQDPGIQNALKAGMSVREFADPYVQLAARTLNINPDSVDLEDGKWNQALNWTDPNGVRRAQTLDEWGRNIRTKADYGYDHTVNAKVEASKVALDLAQRFGEA